MRNLRAINSNPVRNNQLNRISLLPKETKVSATKAPEKEKEKEKENLGKLSVLGSRWDLGKLTARGQPSSKERGSSS